MLDARAEKVASLSVEDQAKVTFHVLASLNSHFRNNLNSSITKAEVLQIVDEAIEEVEI